MKNYLLTLLISPVLSAEEVLSVRESLISFIQEKGGTVISQSAPVKQTLGYAIEGISQAYLADLEFALVPELIKDIEEKAKEEENIIRHILLSKKKLPIQKEKRSRPKIETKEPEKRVSQKVTLGDIDKKIDEILNE